MTTKDDIRSWFIDGKDIGMDRMMVVCDTFSYENYPVYSSDEMFESELVHYDGVNMQEVLEVYDLHKDMEKQINEEYAWHTNITKVKHV